MSNFTFFHSVFLQVFNVGVGDGGGEKMLVIHAASGVGIILWGILVSKRKKIGESMGMCHDPRDMSEVILKTALNPIQSISQSINDLHTVSTGVRVMTNFTIDIMLYMRQSVQLDSLPNTTIASFNVTFRLFLPQE